jgi:alginate O-acetyltransferase complex protein AlgI
MIFSTYWFLAAAAIFLPFYWLVKVPKWRFALLLAFCFVFHAQFAGPAGVAPIIALGLVTYSIGKSGNKNWCKFGIALCVLSLCFYKYTHFFCNEVIMHFCPWLGAPSAMTAKHWLPDLPPLAISFFTFEFVHYLFEVMKGGEPIRKITHFAQFTFYFPSLVAGPIKRYSQFLPALEQGLKKVNLRDVSEGLLLVGVGFFKKAVIADNLTAFIDHQGPAFASLGVQMRWVILIAIAFRIYMDFSGYSDMAIGFSRMMGIQLPKNFNWPYLATSIQDFWQRWHISLSSWIRDYVYIPLGGNRLGTARRVFNGLFAFALCGLWHGAAWNFIIWGLYHGVGLAVCSSYRTALGPLGRVTGKVFDKVPAFGWAVTMAFVSIGWLLFFYPVPEAVQMTKLLFTFG